MNRIILVFLMLWTSVGLAATTVYKTVDENGVVSFSDSNSQGEAAEVVHIDTPPVQPAGDQTANLEAMRETTDRMAEDRREREKHRAEIKELSRPSQNAAAPEYIDSYSTAVGGGYYYPPGGPPWRPGHRPKPEHPIVRPPLSHTSSAFRGSNSQLMRPMLSNGR
jgi:TolA-binding protein